MGDHAVCDKLIDVKGSHHVLAVAAVAKQPDKIVVLCCCFCQEWVLFMHSVNDESLCLAPVAKLPVVPACSLQQSHNHMKPTLYDPAEQDIDRTSTCASGQEMKHGSVSHLSSSTSCRSLLRLQPIILWDALGADSLTILQLCLKPLLAEL